MSAIYLSTAKSYLDVIHDYDDSKLQILLDGAEDEAMQFMNRKNMDDWALDSNLAPQLPPSVFVAILLLLQANYDATIDDGNKLRQAAEIKLMPYRVEMGV